MKRILISALLLLVSTSLYAYDIVPKLALDLPGTFKSDYEVEPSVAVAVDVKYPVSNYFSFGAGLEFLNSRTVSDKLSGSYFLNKDFSFLPAYLTVYFYPFGNSGEYKPYLRVDGGYNLNFVIDKANNSSAGIYVSGGIGFELFDRYIMEVVTSRYEGKDSGENITYKKISFKIGYKFTI